jgi:hypothetical protein
MVLQCVSLLRLCPRQLCSSWRPDRSLSAPVGGGEPSPLSMPCLGWSDLNAAQARMSVRLTEKCSSDISARTGDCATSPSSRRSRFLLKVVARLPARSVLDPRPAEQQVAANPLHQLLLRTAPSRMLVAPAA